MELFYREAEKAGGELVDDAEEVGAYEEFEFYELRPEQVRDVAKKVLRKHKVKVTVTGDREVTVEPTAPEPWIRALSQYQGRTTTRCASWSSVWWRTLTGSAGGYHGREGGVVPSDGRERVRVLPRSRNPVQSLILYAGLGSQFKGATKGQPKAEAEAMAEKNLRTIMDRVAEYVGKPHPEWR